MAPLNAAQQRTRARVESLIKVMAPFLDAVLVVGERVSKAVEREDTDLYPVAPPQQSDRGRAARPQERGGDGARFQQPGGDRWRTAQ